MLLAASERRRRVGWRVGRRQATRWNAHARLLVRRRRPGNAAPRSPARPTPRARVRASSAGHSPPSAPSPHQVLVPVPVLVVMSARAQAQRAQQGRRGRSTPGRAHTPTPAAVNVPSRPHRRGVRRRTRGRPRSLVAAVYVHRARMRTPPPVIPTANGRALRARRRHPSGSSTSVPAATPSLAMRVHAPKAPRPRLARARASTARRRWRWRTRRRRSARSPVLIIAATGSQTGVTRPVLPSALQRSLRRLPTRPRTAPCRRCLHAP